MYNQNIKNFVKEVTFLVLISLVISMAISVAIYGLLNNEIINYIILLVLLVMIILRIAKYYSVSNKIGESALLTIVYVIAFGLVTWFSINNSEYDYIRYVQKTLPIIMLLVISGVTINDFDFSKFITDSRNFDLDVVYN